MVFNATFNNIVMVVCFIGDVTSENCQKTKRPSHHHSKKKIVQFENKSVKI